MNSIIFSNNSLFNSAVTALELDATPVYSIDRDTMTINTDDVVGIVHVLHSFGITDFTWDHDENHDDREGDNFRSDGEADADALASAGMGTDEDYEHNSFDEGDF